MITGGVNTDLEATIRLVVQGTNGQSHEIEAVIDTGFNGFLTLSCAQIALFGLPWLCREQGLLADGSTQIFDVYAATVMWDGQLRRVETEAVDVQPLVGMNLLEGCELRIQVVNNGKVTIEALP
jgi:clan AA aspartic protease